MDSSFYFCLSLFAKSWSAKGVFRMRKTVTGKNTASVPVWGGYAYHPLQLSELFFGNNKKHLQLFV